MTNPPDSTFEQYTVVRSVRRVLFLSAHNPARSLIAEAWLRHLGGDQFEVESAGSQPAGAAHPLALTVMQEVGIDLSSAQPRPSDALQLDDYDLVVVLSPRDALEPPRLEGAREVMHWTFADPSETTGDAEAQLRAFRRVRDELRTRVNLFVNATTRDVDPPTSPASTT